MAETFEDELEGIEDEAPARGDVPPPPELTRGQRQHLKRLAHALEAIIQVGHKGVTESLLNEVDQALLAHELIKMKLGRHVPAEIDEVAEAVSRGTGAIAVQTVGKVVTLYRPHPDPERRVIELPGARA